MTQIINDPIHMQSALLLARKAYNLGEVPIGSVITHKDNVIAQAYNRSITDNNPVGHAEILVLQQAAAFLENYRLLECTLYVTVEPCIMCAGALIHSRIKRLVFGTEEPKTGAIVSTMQILDNPQINHRIIYTHGVLESQCRKIMQDFFKQLRETNKKQIN